MAGKLYAPDFGKADSVLRPTKANRSWELLRLVGSSTLFFGGRIAGAVIAYLTQVLLARWLGGAELGSYLRGFSWCIVLANLAQIGLGNGAMRFVGMGLASGDLTHIRGYVRRSRQISILLGCAIAVIACVGVLSLGSQIAPAERRALLIAFLGIPILALVRLHVGISHSFSWFGLTVLPNIVLRPALLLLSAAIAWHAGVLTSATDVLAIHLVVMLIVGTGQFLILQVRLRDQLGATPPVYETSRWIRTGLPLLLTSFFTLFYPELNVVVLGSLVPNDQLAIFSAAFRTAMLIAFGLMAVDAVLLPRAARFHEEGKPHEIQRMLTHAAHVKFWCSLGAFAAMGFAGDRILMLFGKEFVSGYTTLLILAGGLVVRAALGPSAELLNVTGHHNRCLPVFACSLVATVLLAVLLVPYLGINGAAVSVLLVTLGSNLWLHRLATRHLRVVPSILCIVSHARGVKIEQDLHNDE